MIAPNSYVPAGSRIPANTVWAGSPARYVGEVKEEDPSLKESREQIRLMEE